MIDDAAVYLDVKVIAELQAIQNEKQGQMVGQYALETNKRPMLSLNDTVEYLIEVYHGGHE